jgi:O-antigen/teichoic acid export membrane protein
MNDHSLPPSDQFSAPRVRRTNFFGLEGQDARGKTKEVPEQGDPTDRMVIIEKRNQAWRPGSFGFDSDDSRSIWDKGTTLSTLVVQGIADYTGQNAPAMKSEISGAASNAAFIGIGNVGGSLLKYVSNFIMQRGLGTAFYGVYSICFALVNLAAAIFNLGLDDAMVRYVAIYRKRQQSGLLRGLILFCTALAGLSGILGAVVIFFTAPFLAAVRHNSSYNLIRLLQFMSPLIPLLCMQAVWFGGLQGFKAFKWRIIIQRIILPGFSIILLLIFYFFFHSGKPGGIIGVTTITLVATIISVMLNLYYLLRLNFRLQAKKIEPEQYQTREWFNFATLNFLTSVIDVVLESTDTLLLAFFAINDVAIGQYNAAIKLSAFIALPLTSLNVMFAPTIAELHSSGETHKLEVMFKIVTRWAITFSLPIFCVVTLFSEPILSLSRDRFAQAWPLVIAFAIGSIANAATGSVGYMLLMTGHQKLSFLNSLAAVTVNLVLGIIFTPLFGALGTAISTGLAIAVVNVMRLIQVRVLLNIHPYKWEMLKPIAAAAISSALCGGLLYLLRFQSVYLRLTLIVAFLACYSGFVILFKFSSEDQIVLQALRKKFARP